MKINTKLIEELQKELEEEEERISHKDNHGNYAIRLEKKIELLKQGCKVDDIHYGLLVNQRFIVAIEKNKWCIDGKYKWYYYKDIPSFVSKYVRRDA